MTDNTNKTGQGQQNTSFSAGSTGQSINYNTPAIQVGNQVRDGDEFVLLVRSNQGSGFKAWSSGDETVTNQLMQQATRQLQTEPA
jgi:hypothetical protein